MCFVLRDGDRRGVKKKIHIYLRAVAFYFAEGVLGSWTVPQTTVVQF